MARTMESLAQAAKGKPSAFPFWLKQYKVPQDVTDEMAGLPAATFDAFPQIIRKSFSRHNEHPDTTRKLNARPYFLKFRPHERDTRSQAPSAVGLVARIRYYENHLTKLEDPVVQKLWKTRVRSLRSALASLRIRDFPTYWRVMQDFKLWDVVRDRHQGFVDLGAFTRPGPEGTAKVTNAEEYLDPETLYGCEETGETRYAVSRRRGKLFAPGLQVYAKDPLDGLWKLGEIVHTDAENQCSDVLLLAMGEKMEAVDWDEIKPFDAYSTSRPLTTNDAVKGELAEEASRFVYFENLKATDPALFEQEWYQHVCNKYYDGNAPTGSFRGWRQRFMHWDPQTTSHKRIRWVKGMSKYMQRRVHLGYPVRSEIFEGGRDGKLEPWWIQSLPTYVPTYNPEKKGRVHATWGPP